MIVWGGNATNMFLNTGGRYNPSTDSWTATSTTNAPGRRRLHTAVWTGSKMIVWGGWNISTYYGTGGKYNPGSDSWTATDTTGAPVARAGNTAIWTGSNMIVWGGGDNHNLLNSGGRYYPDVNSWVATSTTNAPSSRSSHIAVWHGNEMVVWGGYGGGVQRKTGGDTACHPVHRQHPLPIHHQPLHLVLLRYRRHVRADVRLPIQTNWPRLIASGTRRGA